MTVFSVIRKADAVQRLHVGVGNIEIQRGVFPDVLTGGRFRQSDQSEL